MYFRFILVGLFIVLIAANEAPPRVLIIGDSISLGYTPFVKAHLQGKAEVVHNRGNAGDTGRGLENIREYIGDGNWDVIQFNWGLWDLCYRHPDAKVYGNRDKINGTLTFSVEDYKANLDSLVCIMKELSNAELVFLTTTYVPQEEAGRFAEDVEIYNNAAKEVMAKYDVRVHDIYDVSAEIHKEYGIGSDDVHYTKEGSEKLGVFVSNYLEQVFFKDYE